MIKFIRNLHINPDIVTEFIITTSAILIPGILFSIIVSLPNRNFVEITTYETECQVEYIVDDVTDVITDAATESVVSTTTESIGDETINAANNEYQYNLYLLAHLIYAESGSDWCSDEMQMYVGSVALNRVNHEVFPDTLYDVIYQYGQYACTWYGTFDYEPNQRAWDMAKYLLDNGSQLPEYVVFQAEFTQGDGIYIKVQNMYFCYLGD